MADQTRVFISHHHSFEDDAFSAQLMRDLEAVGIDVWVDEKGITSGSVVQKISAGLKDRQWLLFIMTPAALSSPWVQSEVVAGLQEVHAGRMRGVIPIVASAVTWPKRLCCGGPFTAMTRPRTIRGCVIASYRP